VWTGGWIEKEEASERITFFIRSVKYRVHQEEKEKIMKETRGEKQEKKEKQRKGG